MYYFKIFSVVNMHLMHLSYLYTIEIILNIMQEMLYDHLMQFKKKLILIYLKTNRPENLLRYD